MNKCLIFCVSLTLLGGSVALATPPTGKPTPVVAPAEKPVTTKTGLKYIILKPGKGAVATAGETVTMHYTGWLTDDGKTKGKKFDSSVDRGQPFPFKLGAKEVIAGWDQGVAGMKVGEKRRLIIPSQLAYGAPGRPGIPPNATLIFDVELVSIP